MESIRNRALIARDFLSKRALCDGMPVEFSVELTSRCNLVCVMCPRDNNATRGLGDMKLETFKRIMDEASRYVEFVYLTLAGEPLMHPRFGEFIAYAESVGVKTGISTNGTVLGPEQTETLLNSSLSNLIISIDATDAETYKKIRGANSFDKVVRNTEHFLRRKKELGRGPYTILQMICLNENSSQTREFVERWNRLGADAVRLKRFFNFAGHVEDRGYGQSVPAERLVRGPTQPAPAPVSAPVEATPRPPCFLLWRQLAFYYDGTAVSCCHDFLHESELGNIHEKTLAEIWNSPVMVEMRRKHIEGRQSEIPLCAGCNQPEASVPAVLAVTALSARATKTALIAAERVTRRLGLKSPY